ncbi:MAG: hypothetical protein COB53_06150 [Elusimicrobia bacterium]|nr:MAG: hypothetical protein COB53_06150 [Elusimicrobiota bacterium]
MRLILLSLLFLPGRCFANDIHWVPGEPTYSFLNKHGKKRTRSLPPLPKKGEWKRQLLFPKNGAFFCVLDEKTEEFGLHLGSPRGAVSAKMAVSASILRLVRKGGRTVWKQRLRERHFGGALPAGEIPLQISETGTLALLLQDNGPYKKSRPFILVVGPRGHVKLELNYTVWSRVDELSLSTDGSRLAVRGLGRIPEQDNWGKAVGVYDLKEDTAWVRGVPDAETSAPTLRVDRDGWVCCVREGPIFVAFDPGGRRERMEAAEMERRFGAAW